MKYDAWVDKASLNLAPCSTHTDGAYVPLALRKTGGSTAVTTYSSYTGMPRFCFGFSCSGNNLPKMPIAFFKVANSPSENWLNSCCCVISVYSKKVNLNYRNWLASRSAKCQLRCLQSSQRFVHRIKSHAI